MPLPSPRSLQLHESGNTHIGQSKLDVSALNCLSEKGAPLRGREVIRFGGLCFASGAIHVLSLDVSSIDSLPGV